MNRIDLHTHSSKSDGTLSPSQLIASAYDSGLHTVALTDHDTADGLAEAAAAAKALQKNHPFEFIPGIELSVSYMERELHLVGLYLDLTSDAFAAALTQLQDNREARNEKIITLMQAEGIDITLKKMCQEQGNGVKTRANFARYLYNHGYIKSIKEGFDKYLAAGRPFYVPREYMDPKDAIDLIHSVGGLAVLAHPLLYHFSFQALEIAIKGLKAMGLDAIEVYYSMNTHYDTVNLKKLALKYGLVPSGGSDFHGSNKPHIQLGLGRGNLYIPEDVIRLQKEYLSLRKKIHSHKTL